MAMVTTSSEKAIHPGSGLDGLVDADHGAGGVDPPCDETHLDALGRRQGEAQGEGVPSRTEATPRSRAAWSTRLRVPIWSSGPHRPQLETRAAISVNEVGIEGGTGTGTAQLYPKGQQFFARSADREGEGLESQVRGIRAMTGFRSLSGRYVHQPRHIHRPHVRLAGARLVGSGPAARHRRSRDGGATGLIGGGTGCPVHAPGRRGTTGTVAAVQSLYAEDLVARINAERAARARRPSPNSRSTPS